MLVCLDDISDTPVVMDAVGGGAEDVPSCDLDGRGPEVPGPELY